MRRFSSVISALALCALSVPALAATQVADGGFETQAAGVGGFCYFGAGGCPSGVWSGLNGGGLQDETNGAWPGASTPDGSKYGFIQNTGYFEQTFTANDTGIFNLSWLEAGRPAGCCQGNQSYNVLLNSLVVANSSTTTSQPFGAASSANFNLVSGNAYTLRFQGLSTGPDNTAFIDRVSLAYVGPSGAVPEPGAWALMIAGFGGVGAMLRRRRISAIAA